jgi:hypothetical protein
MVEDGLKAHTHFSEMLASLDAAEADLIGSVRRKRRTLKNTHALGLALENDLDAAERKQLLAEDFALRVGEWENVKDGGKEAGQARKKTMDMRVEVVGELNQQLIAKIKPNGLLSVSRAAEIFLSRWEELGDGGKAPSLTTARRWLKKLITSS